MTRPPSEELKNSPNGDFLEIRNLTKYFGDDRAVDSISFGVPEGKFLTLLGPSGCGKTTILMCISGLLVPDTGEISIGGLPVTSISNRIIVPSEKRNIGMVFQSYAIWPHMTVAQNIAYPLEIRRMEKAEIEDRVADILRIVGLSEMANKSATKLSGGQQQRTALARALVFRPRLLLFDEPLSNLDLKLRERMRIELKRIQNEVGITTVYVTHDQSEALVMSDEIIVMSTGTIQQRGVPQAIYAQPVNQYVSQFIGEANLIEGRISAVLGGGRGQFELKGGAGAISLPCLLTSDMTEGGAAILLIRPEAVTILRKPEIDAPRIEGEIVDTIFLGNYVYCRVRCSDFEWKVQVHPRMRLEKGERVFLQLDPDRTLAVHP